MRLKFFLIILSVLLSTTAAVTYVHINFFRSERLKLIDSQIKKSADILVGSALANSNNINFEVADSIISEELGGDRIGKIFRILKSSGETVYASKNIETLPFALPIDSDWTSIRSEERFIRLHNLHLPKYNLILQIGLVLNPNFLSWSIMNARVWTYIVLIVFSNFLLSAGLTLVLLSPIGKLASELKDRGIKLNSHSLPLKGLSPKLMKFTDEKNSNPDEFSTLVRETHVLIQRINLYHKLTRAWAFQLAHELKTPLAVTRAELETLIQSKKADFSELVFTLNEIDHISGIIREFLNWAELENASLNNNLHAVKTEEVVTNIIKKFERINPGRIRLLGKSSKVIFTNPIYFDQMFTNLITNAIKFSPQNSQILIRLENHYVEIEDQGGGIPRDVIQRLGQPFNIGGNKTHSGERGSGLGLAWVNTVAKLYRWDLAINNSAKGALIRISFPEPT